MSFLLQNGEEVFPAKKSIHIAKRWPSIAGAGKHLPVLNGSYQNTEAFQLIFRILLAARIDFKQEE
jgi:hypothetical protein